MKTPFIALVGLAAVLLLWPFDTMAQDPVITPTPIITATPTPSDAPTPTATPTATATPSPTPTPNSQPETPLKQPIPEDVEILANVIWGEARGCSKLQKSGVAWVVCNRVDSHEYPNTVREVITQWMQFHGYSPDNTPTAEEYEIARDVLVRWLNGLEGRTLPERFLYFHSDRKGKNIFTTDHRQGEEWNWSLPNIYETEDTL